MPVYSHSRLSTYETCSRQYKLRYIDRIRPPEGEEGIEAFLGSMVHEALKKFYKELKEQQQQFELELDRIGEAAAEYARGRDITTIAGSEYILNIWDDGGYQFPRSHEEKREDLEKFIKKTGMWEQLSMLNIRRLEKITENERLDNKLRDWPSNIILTDPAVNLKQPPRVG